MSSAAGKPVVFQLYVPVVLQVWAIAQTPAGDESATAYGTPTFTSCALYRAGRALPI